MHRMYPHLINPAHRSGAGTLLIRIVSMAISLAACGSTAQKTPSKCATFPKTKDGYIEDGYQSHDFATAKFWCVLGPEESLGRGMTGA